LKVTLSVHLQTYYGGRIVPRRPTFNTVALASRGWQLIRVTLPVLMGENHLS